MSENYVRTEQLSHLDNERTKLSKTDIKPIKYFNPSTRGGNRGALYYIHSLQSMG